jgi:hypothetical protein
MPSRSSGLGFFLLSSSCLVVSNQRPIGHTLTNKLPLNLCQIDQMIRVNSSSHVEVHTIRHSAQSTT